MGARTRPARSTNYDRIVGLVRRDAYFSSRSWKRVHPPSSSRRRSCPVDEIPCWESGCAFSELSEIYQGRSPSAHAQISKEIAQCISPKVSSLPIDRSATSLTAAKRGKCDRAQHKCAARLL